MAERAVRQHRGRSEAVGGGGSWEIRVENRAEDLWYKLLSGAKERTGTKKKHAKGKKWQVRGETTRTQ